MTCGGPSTYVDVVVTGVGVVAPIGVGIREFSNNMFAAASGIIDIRGTRVPVNFPVKAGAPVSQCGVPCSALFPEYDCSSPLSRRMAAFVTEEALGALSPGLLIDGIVYATSDGVDFDLMKESFRVRAPWRESSITCSENSLRMIRRIVFHRGNGDVSEEKAICINNACVSGNQAIGVAFDRIRSRQWRRALAGGGDARCNDHSIMSHHMLGALTTEDASHASCPFSKRRSGFVRGEGAAIVLLESRDAAEERGACVLARIAGYSSTSDAYRLTDGHPDAKGAISAMRGAITDGSYASEEISAISAHGTSTRLNDLLETKAIKNLFGKRAYDIPVTSLKSQIGHSTVACGAIETVASVMMLKSQMLAPTINYAEVDPECDLDYVPNQSRAARLETILSNNFGFGGQNSCLIIARNAA